ncbi:helix-turn-helix domain-containing protein [Bacillus pumilus]|uniref:XRE family transcriptional regulator n=2 Tax=Bacillus pumilus TaxID=1408 RepID=A0AAD0MMA9_BACPU|nr:XRE family transcriptional regulator [Bacillus pumilus]TYS39759.1 helix-turn-helix transcriptional regulator [Bacillus pumilus]
MRMFMIYFKLDELLKQHKYSRTQFAHLAGVRPNTINDMCNGNTKRLELETLNHIIHALNKICEEPIKLTDLMDYGEGNKCQRTKVQLKQF